jgi:protein-L-isoaspartate(D-aspartate) O-methyltransferase
LYREGVDNHRIARRRMVEKLASGGAVYSRAVLTAMEKVPRHLFVSEALRYRSYEDTSLPIGRGQTISRPSTVGKMLQALGLHGGERVLEIGTGSGYQSALLGELASHVVSMERIEDLHLKARENLLHRLKCRNITLLLGGDFKMAGGAFDSIIVSAGAEALPRDLLACLGEEGVLVIPLGNGGAHSIMRYVKTRDGRLIEDDLGRTSFVPLVVGNADRAGCAAPDRGQSRTP